MRRGFSWGVGVVLAAIGVSVAPAAVFGDTDEDPRSVAEFFQGLRERGYYDLATEYLDTVRKQPDAPLGIKETAEYEFGRLLLDEASKTGDLTRRKDLLDQARTKLDAFTKGSPNHPKAPEALVELARLLTERGHLAMLMADELENQADKDAKIVEARGSFDLARTAYTSAETRLKTEFEKYPKTFIADTQVRQAKEDVHVALMNAQLQKAVVDYEQGLTYKTGAAERNDLMGKALAQFDQIYKSYRTQMAGLTARMWQGKCYEERGELGPAMGVYNELMQHQEPLLRPLQRYVGYFRILVLAKRQEYALAADEAARWLAANNNPAILRSNEGLGVQLELAKNILAQLPSSDDEGQKAAAVKRATDVLSQVVRYTSKHKAEAIELLKKYKPKAAANVLDVAKMNYDDAISTGEQAIASQEWDRAIPLLKQAIKKAEQAKDIDKVNYARYDLAFSYYMSKQYYEAYVLCEHLARRYPRAGLSAKAGEMGMASLAEAYQPSYVSVDRTTDVRNLIDLAQYLAETYPDQDQGDNARLTLGQVYHGTGKYEDAIKAFDAVRPKSGKWVEALTRVGGSHWQQSLVLRNKGETAPADAEQAKAVETLKSALKIRKESDAPPTDPALINNACDLADVYLQTGHASDALAILDPLIKEQKPPYGPTFPKLASLELRAHIGTNQVDLAIADMNTLEKAGGSGSSQAQLYHDLGKLLEKEMDTLKAKGDSAGLNRMQIAYQKFLNALVASKSGQTYETLTWAGTNLLTLGKSKDARGVFELILSTYKDDPKFLAQANAQARLMLARLKLATALRLEAKYEDAAALVEELTKENPKAIEILMEKGMLLEAEAASTNAAKDWSTAFKQWQMIALRLQGMRVKPVEYYDAWYHAAFCLNREGKAKEARQTLAGIMRLSPKLGNPEMKKKYETLLEQIK